MAIILLAICFLSLFINLGASAGTGVDVKEVLLKTVLLFSVVIVFITEIASAFHLLNFWFLCMFWIAASLASVFYLGIKKEKAVQFIITLREYVSNNFNAFNKLEKGLSFLIAAILLLIFIQGIIYPPNNWDSNVYHLARVTNWISHQSIAYYPSHIYRQIYQPPFSGFVLLQFNVLNGGDYLSNSLQFSFLIFSIFAIVSIVDLIGLTQAYKIISIALLVTIPEVILEASSTQNDIVFSFFILASTLFAAKSVIEIKFQNYLFLGLSIGLAMLTKGTAYLYLAPVLLIFGALILVKLYKTKKLAYLNYSIIAALLCLSINTTYYVRNYKLSKNILGVDSAESKMYSNAEMSPALLASSIIKNAGLHMGPYPIGKISNYAIGKLHLMAGIDINNPKTNFKSLPYSGAPKYSFNENVAPNSIPLYLTVLSFMAIFAYTLKNRKSYNKTVLFLSTVIFLQMILFCLYLRWQPFHTRLHMPLFMLSVPLVCYAASLNNKYLKILYFLMSCSILYAAIVIVFNNTRPFWSSRYTARIHFNDDRYKKYFADSRLFLYDEYKSTSESISKLNYKNIGLILGEDDYEYPLFCQGYGKQLNPVHINVSNNISKNIPLVSDNIDCIVSTTLNDTAINFNGKRFYNQNQKNSFIWFYKP